MNVTEAFLDSYVDNENRECFTTVLTSMIKIKPFKRVRKEDSTLISELSEKILKNCLKDIHGNDSSLLKLNRCLEAACTTNINTNTYTLEDTVNINCSLVIEFQFSENLNLIKLKYPHAYRYYKERKIIRFLETQHLDVSDVFNTVFQILKTHPLLGSVFYEYM